MCLDAQGSLLSKCQRDLIAESEADVILVMLCGYDAARNAAEFRQHQVAAEREQSSRASRRTRFRSGRQWLLFASGPAPSRRAAASGAFVSSGSVRL